MKPNRIILGIAALGFLALGCQKPDTQQPDIPDEGNNQEGQDVPVAIQIKAKQDVWNHDLYDAWQDVQKLYLFCYTHGLESDKIDYAKDMLAEIDNLEVSAPDSEAEGLIDFGAVVNYKPDLVYDFYGYSIDDAWVDNMNSAGENVPDNKPDVIRTSSTLEIPFKIDGSQDLMLARTDKSADCLEALYQVPFSRVYSAYAARRGVQPNLLFDKVLSQFVFKVMPKDGAERVQINGIKIINTKDEGSLDIINGKLISDDDYGAELILDAGTSTFPFVFGPKEEWDTLYNTPKQIGSSLMVIPGETEYTLQIDMVETGYEDAKRDSMLAKLDIRDVVVGSSSSLLGKFAAGKSYTVIINVYGWDMIDLSIQLLDNV